MRWFRNKRASEALTIMVFIAFEGALAVFFIFIMMSRMRDVSSSTDFHEKYFSKDLALITDSLQASDDELLVYYDFSSAPAKKELLFNISEDRVYLSDASKSSDSPFDRTFFIFGLKEGVIITSAQRKTSDKKMNISFKDYNVSWVETK